MSAAHQLDRRLLDRVVPRMDGWRRRASGDPSDAGSYKEWMHFCVCLPGPAPGHLLFNVNVAERLLSTGVERQPRVIALGYLGRWTGVVDTFSDEQTRNRLGEIALQLGDNQLFWNSGAYHLRVSNEHIRAQLRLEPVTLPTVASSVSFGPGRDIHWVVIPRLEASGWVQLGWGPTLQLDRALAYHDHNWGHFRWGADLAWEWGFVNPADASCPWSVVFVRVSDGGRHRTLSQGALLWHGSGLVRSFQDQEISLALEGVHRGPRPLTLPKIASLLVPGSSTGVPARVSLEAKGLEDLLQVDFETSSVARVAIPSEIDPFRLVLLNETCGNAHVTGVTGGEAFDFEGPAVMEFVRG